MATVVWRGDAMPQAQVEAVFPADVSPGDLFVLRIGGRSVRHLAAGDSVEAVVAGLAEEIALSDAPEWAEVEAAPQADHLRIVARRAGVPFTLAAEVVPNGGSGAAFTRQTLVPSAGPHHWDTPENWSTGALPATGDQVVLPPSDVSILYGLDQAATVLASLRIEAGFRGEIGLPRINRQGERPYVEYRPLDLAIAAAAVEIGGGDGPGSGRIQLDTGEEPTALTLHRSGLPAEEDQPAVRWRGSHPANALSVLEGSLGVALRGGETAQIAVLRQAGGDVQIGGAVLLETVERSGGGRLVLRGGAETLSQSGGETLILGDEGVASLHLDGGQVDYRGAGTIGSVTIDAADAVLDFSADLRGRTVEECHLYRGAIVDPHGTVTWTSGIQPLAGLAAP